MRKIIISLGVIINVALIVVFIIIINHYFLETREKVEILEDKKGTEEEIIETKEEVIRSKEDFNNKDSHQNVENNSRLMDNSIEMIIDFGGKKYQQGVVYYSEEDIGDCFYYIYVLRSYIINNNTSAFLYCRQECKKTGGLQNKYISLNKLDSEGRGYIFAYRCVCDKC